jgi:hypothetical protein
MTRTGRDPRYRSHGPLGSAAISTTLSPRSRPGSSTELRLRTRAPRPAPPRPLCHSPPGTRRSSPRASPRIGRPNMTGAPAPGEQAGVPAPLTRRPPGTNRDRRRHRRPDARVRGEAGLCHDGVAFLLLAKSRPARASWRCARKCARKSLRPGNARGGGPRSLELRSGDRRAARQSPERKRAREDSNL